MNRRKRQFVVEVTVEPDFVSWSDKRIRALIEDRLERYLLSINLKQVISKTTVRSLARWQQGQRAKLKALKARIEEIGDE